jgi:hypothetical protein
MSWLNLSGNAIGDANALPAEPKIVRLGLSGKETVPTKADIKIAELNFFLAKSRCAFFAYNPENFSSIHYSCNTPILDEENPRNEAIPRIYKKIKG